MHTRVLMTSCAAFLTLLGVAASFLPQELLTFAGSAADKAPVLVMQAAGALLLSFAVLNWMARGILIGGIYARPVALANFMHFSIAAVVFAKALQTGFWIPLAVLLVPYCVFAVWFALVVFTTPTAVSRD